MSVDAQSISSQEGVLCLITLEAGDYPHKVSLLKYCFGWTRNLSRTYFHCFIIQYSKKNEIYSKTLPTLIMMRHFYLYLKSWKPYLWYYAFTPRFHDPFPLQERRKVLSVTRYEGLSEQSFVR